MSLNTASVDRPGSDPSEEPDQEQRCDGAGAGPSTGVGPALSPTPLSMCAQPAGPRNRKVRGHCPPWFGGAPPPGNTSPFPPLRLAAASPWQPGRGHSVSSLPTPCSPPVSPLPGDTDPVAQGWQGLVPSLGSLFCGVNGPRPPHQDGVRVALNPCGRSRAGTP